MSDERCGCAPCQGCSLTDLEAMRAELEGYIDGALLLDEKNDEIDRLRAELADMTALAESENARGRNAREAIARVRELVDEADGEPKRLFWPSEVLRALDGGAE